MNLNSCQIFLSSRPRRPRSMRSFAAQVLFLDSRPAQGVRFRSHCTSPLFPPLSPVKSHSDRDRSLGRSGSVVSKGERASAPRRQKNERQKYPAFIFLSEIFLPAPAQNQFVGEQKSTKKTKREQEERTSFSKTHPFSA